MCSHGSNVLKHITVLPKVTVTLQQVGDGSCPSVLRVSTSQGLLQLALALLTHYSAHIFTVLCVVLTAASLAIGEALAVTRSVLIQWTSSLCFQTRHI